MKGRFFTGQYEGEPMVECCICKKALSPSYLRLGTIAKWSNDCGWRAQKLIYKENYFENDACCATCLDKVKL